MFFRGETGIIFFQAFLEGEQFFLLINTFKGFAFRSMA